MFHGHSQRQHDMAKKALASKTGEVKYLQQGPVGPLVYPTGEYAASVSYTRTPLSAPMVLCEGQYYVLNKEGTFKNINPKKDYAANGSKATWVLMDKVRYSFVEILMANFAKLASAVFYGQYMFSQYGVRADGSAVETEGGYKDFNYSDPMNPANGFRPNLLIDFLRGIFYGRNVEVDGGVFRNIRSPNGAFRIEDNGDIKIIGKFSTSLNGTRIELDPDTNSIRMYNQNNSVIGEIKFMEEQWNGNINYLPMVRLRNYHNSEEFGDTILRAGSIMINDSSLGNDVYSALINPSIGLAFSKNGVETKRYSSS